MGFDQLGIQFRAAEFSGGGFLGGRDIFTEILKLIHPFRSPDTLLGLSQILGFPARARPPTQKDAGDKKERPVATQWFCVGLALSSVLVIPALAALFDLLAVGLSDGEVKVPSLPGRLQELISHLAIFPNTY